MRPRNVIFSLIVVLVMLAIIFYRIRTEPRKKLTFNRNPSRIEYSQFALCRMGCYNINANSIAVIFRKGIVSDRRRKETCTIFVINATTKPGINIVMIVDQCGTVAKVTDCFYENSATPCNCTDRDTPPVS